MEESERRKPPKRGGPRHEACRRTGQNTPQCKRSPKYKEEPTRESGSSFPRRTRARGRSARTCLLRIRRRVCSAVQSANGANSRPGVRDLDRPLSQIHQADGHPFPSDRKGRLPLLAYLSIRLNLSSGGARQSNGSSGASRRNSDSSARP